jgi:hypothetical protein
MRIVDTITAAGPTGPAKTIIIESIVALAL